MKRARRRDSIAAVTRQRVMTLLVGIGLAVLCLAPPAWAHPGHGPPGVASASDGLHAPGRPETSPESWDVADSWEGLRRHAPASAALVVGALALLATMPHRRRVLALALIGLLGMVSLEGAVHAALHLHQVRHADNLAIGASPVQQSAADLDTEGPAAVPDTLLVEVAERYDPPATAVVLASNRGRAPPISPA